MREVDINRGALLVRRERVALVRLQKVPALEGAPVWAGARAPIGRCRDECEHKHRRACKFLTSQAAKSQMVSWI
jgi:hypothetical protein